jgi:hypothetical protein
MNVKILLLFLMIISCVSCVSKKYILIQNKTDHDIHIYKKVTYDIPKNDSVMKLVIQKNNIDSYYKDEILTMDYYTILKKDSIVFLDIIYGEKSKTELVDSNTNYLNTSLMIISNSDTTRFTQREIIKKVNEVWVNRNSNPYVKLEAHEKNRLIWEFKD